MRLYKCDRCGKLLEPFERCSGHIDKHIGDFCPQCHKELMDDLDSVERLHTKQMNALLVKYGLQSIKEIIMNKEVR